MKKMTALVLALVLSILCVPALAEDAAVQDYTNTELGFTVTLPGDWLVVDRENVDAYIAAYEKGEMTFTGTNAPTLQQLKPLFAAQNMAIAISPNAYNVTLSSADLGIALTNEQFIEMLIPVFKEQIASSMPGMQIVTDGEVLPLGDNEFIFLSGELDMNVMTAYADQMFLLKGTKMYLVNVTSTNVFGEEMQNAFYAQLMDIIASFTVLE